jgi:VIT1/CCC1 family predicted Fe2+/Mn2+ transporter
MKNSFRKGVSFGVTSAIITTLGLMTGLNASTGSVAVVIAGILVIAVADAMSDALGMHISEESEDHHSQKEIWEATLATFGAKFVIACTFLVPVLLLPLGTAITASIVWGLFLISALSYVIAKNQKVKPLPIIAEHVIIAIAVIAIANYIGEAVAAFAA